jgi:protein-S-isoprenylcysteine O-methyltransferase Ste14
LTDTTKWLVAIPFAFIISLAIPGLVAGGLLWFTDCWAETVYVACSAGMWLVATAFVDLRHPRSDPDVANRLLPIGLVLSVPISVWDHVYGIASLLPSFMDLVGFMIAVVAILLGIWSRVSLGHEYSPRAGPAVHSDLVQSGPYQLIRHPMYLSAILWAVGWPLLIASLIGGLVALLFILPAILIRMRSEERELSRVHGDQYEEYRNKTWRLIPGIY